MGADIPPGAAPESPTDDELIAAARRGDAAALEALLVRYQPRLYRFGLRMCGSSEDADDVAQDSLLAMARSVRGFRGESSVSSWLYTIARRFCLRKRRRSRFAPAREESLDTLHADTTAQGVIDRAPSPEQTAANRELEVALARAIEALDPPQREVLVLRDVEGLPASDVASVLGLRVEAVKSRLHRARLAVRQMLTPLLAPASAAVPDRARTDTPRASGCPDVLTLFSRHLEGEIEPELCARLEAHLAQCSHCRGASPLTGDLDHVRRAEDGGCAAIVMHSLFEEQITERLSARLAELPRPTRAAGLERMPTTTTPVKPHEYLDQLRRIKSAVSVPVIASLNGAGSDGWLSYARLIEQAGPDALELNVYAFSSELSDTSRVDDPAPLRRHRAVSRDAELPPVRRPRAS